MGFVSRISSLSKSPTIICIKTELSPLTLFLEIENTEYDDIESNFSLVTDKDITSLNIFG